jgi:hypothetical protein
LAAGNNLIPIANLAVTPKLMICDSIQLPYDAGIIAIDQNLFGASKIWSELTLSARLDWLPNRNPVKMQLRT